MDCQTDFQYNEIKAAEKLTKGNVMPAAIEERVSTIEI